MNLIRIDAKDKVFNNLSMRINLEMISEIVEIYGSGYDLYRRRNYKVIMSNGNFYYLNENNFKLLGIE